jgi:hypothetical protein
MKPFLPKRSRSPGKQSGRVAAGWLDFAWQADFVRRPYQRAKPRALMMMPPWLDPVPNSALEKR